MIHATKSEIASVFMEWDRQFRESPQQFFHVTNMLQQSYEVYAEMAADQFIELIREIQARQKTTC